jgi:type IV pilus assembly protein PilW
MYATTQVMLRQSPARQQSGFTLIEIMVALLLGLLVISGVIQLFISTQQSARVQQAASRLQEDGRIALLFLNRYIRLAGYTTNPWDNGETVWNPVIGDRGFAATGVFTQAVGQVLTGGDNNINNRDSIRIRYQGAADGSITDCLGNIVPVNQMADITFSISDLTNNERSLWCTDNTAATPTPQPLVGGIQDMQIWYGLSPAAGRDVAGRLTGGATAYVRAGLVPATQWNLVTSVRVSLLLRSVDDRLTLEEQSYTFPPLNDDGTINTTLTNPNDRRLRYVMGTTINLRNEAP